MAGSVSFRGVENIPPDFRVVLINLYNAQPVDLRLHPEYHYAAVSPRMQFKILVGTKVFIDREITKFLPQSYELVQNFQNPFNLSTAIQVRLPKESRIRLDIYSILGQHVKTLAEGEYAQGIFTFLWDGTDEHGQIIASGVYLYRLLANGSAVQSKKMILAK